ncbi:MAG: glycosyltransferase [candidate division WOR-3 bacterium]|nr:MAG: glycosyltransferase [candidate division WOR-3 bacterium]
MKILHVAIENFQDVPGLLCRSHGVFGDDSTLVTLARSRLGFPNGIPLDYPLFNEPSIRILRRIAGRENVNVLVEELQLKIRGENRVARGYYRMRDVVWLTRLYPLWRRYGLGDFDVYHFDGDLPFIFGDRMLRRLKHKKIVTHFFGSELRKWGMNPFLREYAQLRITSELDHTKIDPELVFIPIPYDATAITPRYKENSVLRVGHSPTRRTAKGTADIITAVQELKKEIDFEFLLIEGVSHAKCMDLKRSCDIGIDQIGNYAGTGYGRSGLEFLALGIPTITEIPDEYEPLLPGHPFVKATIGNFKDILYRLLRDKALRQKKRKRGIAWVRTFPHPYRIISRVYEEYKKLGWI